MKIRSHRSPDRYPFHRDRENLSIRVPITPVPLARSRAWYDTFAIGLVSGCSLSLLAVLAYTELAHLFF